MQQGQDRHDRTAHLAVLEWPLQKRLRHYFLHFGKYCWVMELAKRKGGLPQVKTVADLMIITLASANALNLDLATQVAVEREARSPEQALVHLHDEVICAISPLFKTFEGLDHEEHVFLEDSMRNATIRVARAILAYVEACSLDIESLVARRWWQVEKATA